MSLALVDHDEPENASLALTSSPTSQLWRPRTQADLAPSGEKAKARANLAALTVLRRLQASGQPADEADARTLAHWAGWGAVPNIFDEADQSWAAERAELRSLLDDTEWAAARRTTINAHYTSAEVVAAMWAAVVQLGFAGGRVLEPGCGSGNFIGLAPELPMEMIGVELDPVTAAIAATLYPAADIRAQGFEDTTFAPDHFDLVVGNVPFAKIALHDPVFNKARHSVHNYFILKALEFLRPGGLMAVLTSRFTLDSRNSAARREMAERADLVGALRLPEGAFKAAAGTRAIIDMLILRKRPNGPSLFAAPWYSLAPLPATGPLATVEANEYFAAHPDHILGTLSTQRGMYTKDEPTVVADGDLAPQLVRGLTDIITRARNTDLTYVSPARPLKVVKAKKPVPPVARPATGGTVAGPDASQPTTLQVPPPPRKEGTILTHEDGFGIVRYGVIEPFEPMPRSDAAELRQIVYLRDLVAALLETQATNTDDAGFAAYQQALNLAYDAYVDRFGPLNRFTLRPTGRRAHECPLCGHQWIIPAKNTQPVRCPGCREPYAGEGTDRTARIRPRMGGFRLHDPDYAAVIALENFDGDTQTATKAPIFSVRVVSPRTHRREAATVEDALSICLDEHGDVRLDVIAKLLGIEAEQARDALGDLVWENPVTAALEPAARYLSGNVRIKLAEARLAAAADERFMVNVEALEKVLPEDLGPTEIDARLGATWIDTDIIVRFVKEVLMDLDTDEKKRSHHVEVNHVPVTATWSVYVAQWERSSVALSSTWGTGRCDAATLVQFSLNQSPAAVYDTVWDGDRKVQVKNVEETLAALEKQETVDARFADWVWEDHDRANALVRIYNDRFNSTVTPTFDGSHLSLPGLAHNLIPHPHQHQLNSIWRTICEPTVGLFHPVGAGKTLVMVAAGIEMRRLGLVNKPAYVVPNHMLEQFAGEFIQHYPRARVLIATKEQTTAAARKEFVARCAMGDWDAIVITSSAFERIPVSAGTRAEFLAEKMDELRSAIKQQEEAEGHRVSIKRMENALVKLEERHARLLAEHRKDDGVNFEATGIDYIHADEAHYYKNMAFPTRISAAGGSGSQRAEDLEVKLAFLRSRHGERVCTLSTATPVANSLAEIFVMQRYLQPEALREAQVYEFDAWAANFGKTINQVELSPDGSSYRIGTRFARFRNVPDLMAMFRQVADVRTPDELNLPTPAIAGGQAEVIAVPTTDALATYMLTLAQRAEDVRKKAVDPTEDNMLKVSTDGRKAALHLRLVVDEDGRPLAPDGPHKTPVLAETIAGIFHAHRHDRYRDSAGNVAPRPGACQLVFCDLGTPREGQWSVYAELRDDLHALGLPAGSVRFIHDAVDDRAKAELFAACRDGRVAVLVASTAKGGVGTNIQARLIAEHHLDCPWRPCDIEQREGRILRQGNQNAVVRIVRYVTEKSFDTYLWQTVARKAAFIYQVMSGKFKGREVDDIGEQALSYAEVKALTTGNPLLMEQAGVDQEVAKLTRAARAHNQDQWRLEHTVGTARDSITLAQRQVDQCEAAIAARTDTRGERFSMRIGRITSTKRAEAGELLLRAIQMSLPQATKEGVHVDLGELAGLPVIAQLTRRRAYSDYYGGTFVEVLVRVKGTPIFISMIQSELGSTDPQGLIVRLEHRIQDLEDTQAIALAAVARHQSELDKAEARIGAPFAHADELARLESRAAEIAAILEAQAIAQDKARSQAPPAA